MDPRIALCAIQTQDLISELVKLSKIKEMQITLTNSLQSGLIVGGITTFSALVAGPIGVGIGGIIGTGIASYCCWGKFKSATEIILYDLNDEQRERLAYAVKKVLTPQNIMTIAHFIAAMQSNQEIISSVVSAVQYYLTTELNMSIKQLA